MPRSLQRRVMRLEATRTATDGRYAIQIGDEPYVTWEGQRVPLDEWQRLYPDAMLINWLEGGDGDDIGMDGV